MLFIKIRWILRFSEFSVFISGVSEYCLQQIEKYRSNFVQMFQEPPISVDPDECDILPMILSMCFMSELERVRNYLKKFYLKLFRIWIPRNALFSTEEPQRNAIRITTTLQNVEKNHFLISCSQIIICDFAKSTLTSKRYRLFSTAK